MLLDNHAYNRGLAKFAKLQTGFDAYLSRLFLWLKH